MTLWTSSRSLDARARGASGTRTMIFWSSEIRGRCRAEEECEVDDVRDLSPEIDDAGEYGEEGVIGIISTIHERQFRYRAQGVPISNSPRR